ncbi:MAG TPA: GAF and ANTAR domain-containing protein [Streptosporangiaceae bacterium]|nr:GAF and ANTAR domain-containing protein [Streptosporangiaceae bacterium]
MDLTRHPRVDDSQATAGERPGRPGPGPDAPAWGTELMVHIDEEALRSSLQRLRESAFDADVVGVMKRAVNAIHDVFGYSGAGVMFITESGNLSYVAASDEPGRALEQAQAAAGQGPCYDSYVYAREVISSDLHSDSRWPQLLAQLQPQVRAVAGIPVLLGGSPVGTLNVYRDEPAEWDSSDIRALSAYSGLIAEAVSAALAAQDHSVLADQLRYALDYRVVIERAVGYLMGAHRLDTVTAFDVLRKQARDSRRRVADVATEILGQTGDGGPGGQRPAAGQSG